VCGTAPSDHDVPRLSSTICLRSAPDPVSFVCISEVLPISSDFTYGEDTVSPPLVLGRTRGRVPASMPGSQHAAASLSRCWPRASRNEPEETRSNAFASHLLWDSNRIQF